MGRMCAVPYCKTGYRSDNKKLSLFKVPQERFEQWQRAIPRKDRFITKKDCICELHFRKEDIIRSVETNTYKYDVKFPRLSKFAKPVYFPKCPKYLSQPKSKQRRKLKVASTTTEDVSNATKDSQFLINNNADIEKFNTYSEQNATLFLKLRNEDLQLPNKAWTQPGSAQGVSVSQRGKTKNSISSPEVSTNTMNTFNNNVYEQGIGDKLVEEYTDLQNRTLDLEEKLLGLEKENPRLKENLEISNRKIEHMEAVFEKISTPDQMKKILNSENRNVRRSPEDIASAVFLRSEQNRDIGEENAFEDNFQHSDNSWFDFVDVKREVIDIKEEPIWFDESTDSDLPGYATQDKFHIKKEKKDQCEQFGEFVSVSLKQLPYELAVQAQNDIKNVLMEIKMLAANVLTHK